MKTLENQHVPASHLELDGFPLVSLTEIRCSFFPGHCWTGEAAHGLLLLPGHSAVALPPVLPSRTCWDHVPEWLQTCLLLQGKPQPEVTWSKGGQPLDTNRINVRTTARDTIFYIRQAQRGDSGTYELTVHINGAEDRATLDIQVVGKLRMGSCSIALGLISPPRLGRSSSGWDVM